jgi:hypothetical protein
LSYSKEKTKSRDLFKNLTEGNERDETPSSLHDSIPISRTELSELSRELFIRASTRPDYIKLMKHASRSLVKRLDRDPEALQALKDFMIERGIKIDTTERFWPLVVIGGGFLAGVAVGVLKSVTKHKKQ